MPPWMQATKWHPILEQANAGNSTYLDQVNAGKSKYSSNEYTHPPNRLRSFMFNLATSNVNFVKVSFFLHVSNFPLLRLVLIGMYSGLIYKGILLIYS
jgi:hypothetical protein